MREHACMDVFDAVRTVLAVRSYQDHPIPEEVVARILESARLTGSSMNAQPWHFVAVTEPEMLRRLGGVVKTGPYIADAPLAIAVAVERSSRFGVSDGSRAIQSMVLTAWAEGVGSNWTGFTGMDGVREILGIPDTYDVIAVLPFGYPAEERRAGRKARKPASEVLSRERFGRPFP
jgi:nitroreductase